MDEINDFFDFSKEFERKPVPTGCITGNMVSMAVEPIQEPTSLLRDVNTSYIDEVLKEEQRILKMEDDEEMSQVSVMDTIEPEVHSLSGDEVYDKYPFNLKRETNLPIFEKKNTILQMIKDNSVIVLEGDTGCGKTTQVPQYILDDAYIRRVPCNIVCTQPRKIAAISIARRVCKERKWEEGTICGYQVGLHSTTSEETRLLYCTTGVLLQKLIAAKTMQNYTHILIDEVHERDEDIDFLMIVVRRLLATNSRNCKVILMSATFDTSIFSEYFTLRGQPAPVVRVDAVRMFSVREFYLDDLRTLFGERDSTALSINYEEPGISNEIYTMAIKLLIVIENIEKSEMTADTYDRTAASILIFLPGINEIDNMLTRIEKLNESPTYRDMKMWPLRLHSLISPDDQIKVFNRAPSGHRKIILATNIAESSITVSDVKYVLDFCLTKAMVTNTATNFSTLELQWASQANCRQRAGRAGRVMNGRVYRLVTKYFYDQLQEYGMPEISRCPLENLVLKAKMLEMGPPTTVLALALSPPYLGDIINTILTLKEVGALNVRNRDGYFVQDGDMTYIGRIMVSLPIDIRLSRLILLGYIFSVMEDAIIIAAALSVRSIHAYQTDSIASEAAAFIQRIIWADASGSDLFTLLKAYRVWSTMCEQHNMQNDISERKWARRFFINIRTMRELHLLVMELKERLSNLGLSQMSSYQHVHWMDREKTIILKVVIAGAFYPNYFVRSKINDIDRERGIYHTLAGNDPCKTVYFTNFNRRHIGQLYTRPIKNLFKHMHIQPKDMEVRFQSGSERVFVTFQNNDDDECVDEYSRCVVPGRVHPSVYKAVRMRTLRVPTFLRVMDSHNEIKYAEKNKIGVMCEGAWKPLKMPITQPELIVLPSVFIKQTRGYVTHIENCSRFYFQPQTEIERLREFFYMLNNAEFLRESKFSNPSCVGKGQIVAAPDRGKYFRAKILKAMPELRNNLQFKVLFIDFGTTHVVNFEDIRQLNFTKYACLVDMPPRVYECRLAMVQPSTIRSPNGKWCQEAIDMMQDLAFAGCVDMEIYSVADMVANVIIKCNETTLNDLLVEKGFATVTDETYMSKMDHDFRLRKQSVSSRFLNEEHKRQNEEYLQAMQPEIDVDIEPPPDEKRTSTIHLRGPFSPLETKVLSAVRVGNWKTVNIERDSVNAVLLDSDPQDMHEQLLVASSITENFNGNNLTARGTTLMPNIRGFGALMTLLFCPATQMKRSADKTQYTAVLAGLGYDPDTYQPLFAEHDIVMNLDVELKKDDIETINQIRYIMDSMLFTHLGKARPQLIPSVVADLSATLKKLILKLLNKNRKYISKQINVDDGTWLPVDRDENVFEIANLYAERAIFPPHSVQCTHDEYFGSLHNMAVHCKELRQKSLFDGAILPTTCQLCNQTLSNTTQLRLHLLSQLHRDREKRIHFKDSHA